MFSLLTKKISPMMLVVFSSISIFWVIDSSAKGISAKVNDVLPHVVIKEASDLVVDGREASKKKIPLLMFFSMEHCPFCIEVEEDYLKPMLRNSEYDNKVLIRKFRIDSTGVVRDFKGKEVDLSDFGENYNVSMVPTLVIVNPKGKKIVPSIIGITNAHYYSGELDEAIDASLQKIRAIAKR